MALTPASACPGVRLSAIAPGGELSVTRAPPPPRPRPQGASRLHRLGPSQLPTRPALAPQPETKPPSHHQQPWEQDLPHVELSPGVWSTCGWDKGIRSWTHVHPPTRDTVPGPAILKPFINSKNLDSVNHVRVAGGHLQGSVGDSRGPWQGALSRDTVRCVAVATVAKGDK